MSPRLVALVACANCESRRTLVSMLAQCGTEAIVSSTVSEAQAVLLERSFGLVFCESDLPEGGFRPVLHTLNLAGSRVPLVVCSLLGELEEYLEAMQLGAFDFIRPPYRHAEVEIILKSALCQFTSTVNLPQLHCAGIVRGKETSQP